MNTIKVNVHSPTFSFPLENISVKDVESYRNTCPICDGTLESVLELVNVDSESLLIRGYCPDCFFSTFIKGPNSNWLKDFYDKRWDRGRPHSHLNDLPKEYLEPLLTDHNAKILDIGCGYGTAISSFLKAGYKNIYGIEHSHKRAEYTKDKFGIEIDHCRLETIKDSEIYKRNGPFDAVYLWHVLEHVVDPDIALKTIHDILTPEGAVFMAVPHLQTEPTVLLAHFFPHLHAFTIESLSRLLEKNGFEILKTDLDLKLGIMLSTVKSNNASEIMNSKNRSSFDLINKKILRDLEVYHTLNQNVGIFIHKYTNDEKGFRYGGKNFYIKRSFYFKWIILLFILFRNVAGQSVFIRLYRFICRRILQLLVPRDLIGYSLLLSIVDDQSIEEIVDKFTLETDAHYLTDKPFRLKFIYPTTNIPIWGK